MKKKYGIIVIFICIVVNTFITRTHESIIQKPIVFNQERIELTKEYRAQHYGINSDNIRITPKIIALHWTDTKTADQAFEIFNHNTLQNRPDLSSASQLNVSAHFLVDRNGQIYQLMPTNWMSRSVIGLNNSTISIENIGGPFLTPHLTAAQVNSNVYLIKTLRKKYSTIKYVIGHQEYRALAHSPLWLEKDNHYHTIKDDPGSTFLQQVRSRL